MSNHLPLPGGGFITTYMGMTLKNPLVPSASPLSKSLTNIRHLEDAGAAAVVLFSLFEKQLASESRALDHYLNYGTESYGEATTYLPEACDYLIGSEEYDGLGTAGPRPGPHR